MSRARRAVVTAGFSYAQYAMAIVPGLVLVPLLLSHLGARTYGLWLTTGELLAYAAMVDPGVLGVLPWLIAEADGAGDRVAVRRLFANGVAAGLVAGIGYVVVAAALWLVLPTVLKLTPADRALLGPPLALIVAATAVTYPLRMFRAALNGLQDVVFAGSLAVVEIALNAVIIAVMLIAGYGVYALAWAAVVSSTLVVVASAVRLVYIAPDLVTRLERPTMADLRMLLGNGIGVWFASFGWRLLSASNGVVIAFLGHPEWVPIYNCTSKVAVVATQLGWVLPDSGLLGLAQLNGERPRSARLKHVVGALVQLHLLLAGLAACSVLAFNPSFVTWWVGGAFFGGVTLNALLAAGIVLYSLIHGLVTAAAVVGNRLQVGIITLVNGVMQIGLAVLFGQRWGLVGVAAAGLLAGTITAVPAALYLLRIAGAAAVRSLLVEVMAVWLPRAAAFIGTALVVGIFYQWLGLWVTGAITVLLGLAYLWQMRPLIRIMPLDPRWVGWLVSLKLIPPAHPATPAEPAA
jgi:O-antigen/teichoic acid export membrane protein